MKSLLQSLFFFFLLGTQICYAQWVQLGLEDKGIKEIAARNSNIFAVTTDSAVYRSTNNGINWSQIIESGAIDIAIAPSGTVFMVGAFPSQYTVLLFSSSNYGDIWDTVNVWEQLPPWTCGVLSMNVSVSQVGIVYCGLFLSCWEKAQPNRIALSTDDGLTWTTPGEEIHIGAVNDFRNQSVLSAGANGLFMTGEMNEFTVENLFSARNDEGVCEHIYLSSDDGHSWSFLGFSPAEYPAAFCGTALSLCLNGNILLGGFGGDAVGLYVSSDSCSTWTQVSTMVPNAGLSVESGGMLIGTDSLGVFLFSDNGDSLDSFNEGLTNLNVQSLSIDNNDYVYAGTDNGLWRRPLSEIVTSAEEITPTLPIEFLLSQNYPNPFNPCTKIKYSVPQSSKFVLKVFDVLGNEIETLVNEDKRIGSYEVNWSAADLPSGVYFYQLKAGDFVQTRKMILLK